MPAFSVTSPASLNVPLVWRQSFWDLFCAAGSVPCCSGRLYGQMLVSTPPQSWVLQKLDKITSVGLLLVTGSFRSNSFSLLSLKAEIQYVELSTSRKSFKVSRRAQTSKSVQQNCTGLSWKDTAQSSACLGISVAFVLVLVTSSCPLGTFSAEKAWVEIATWASGLPFILAKLVSYLSLIGESSSWSSEKPL